MTRLIHAISTLGAEAAPGELIERLRASLLGARPALLVSFSSQRQPLARLLPALQQAFPDTTVVGTSTAGEFTEEGEHPQAAVVMALVGDYQVHASLARGLRQDPEGAAQAAADALPPRPASHAHRTALLFFDGLASVGEEVTLACAAALGPEVPVAGAAAGDDWLQQGTQVGVGAQADTDALALVVIDSHRRLGLGVAHGHRPVGQPTVVTRAEGSVVHELDGRPAWERYVELTRELGLTQWGVDLNTLSEGGDLLRFFAWYQTGVDLGGSYKNRTPLARLPGGAIAFACGIPEGTELRLMSSDTARQVESAREAARQARAQLQGQPVAGALVFECGCRQVYLRDGFSVVPREIARELGDVPLAGLEAYGEVALNVGEFSGFHNATSVVLAFPTGEES